MQTKFEQALGGITEYFLSDLPPITEDTEFSEKFKRRMEKLIKRWEKPYYMLINTAAKRAACVIVCIIIALSALTISARAFLPDVWNIIIEWFDEYMSVGFNADGETDSAPDIIEEIMIPKYVPEGLEISDTTASPTRYTALFSQDEAVVYQFTQCVYKVPLLYDDDSFIQSVSIFEYNGIIITFTDRRCLVWDDGKYHYSIFDMCSSLSDDELIAIAESIYE